MLLALHGILEQVISNNGPQFTSSDFVQLTRANGIQRRGQIPYINANTVTTSNTNKILMMSHTFQVIANPSDFSSNTIANTDT